MVKCELCIKYLWILPGVKQQDVKWSQEEKRRNRSLLGYAFQRSSWHFRNKIFFYFNPLATTKLQTSTDAILLPWQCRIYELIKSG